MNLKKILYSNRPYYLAAVIVWILMGCGSDIELAEDTRIVEVKSPRTHGNANDETWHAEVDVVFSAVPVDLEVEFTRLSKDIQFPLWQLRWVNTDWEQTGEIVTLLFEFPIEMIEQRIGPTSGPVGTEPLERKYQIKSVGVTLTWNTGRKSLRVDAYPPDTIYGNL